MGLGHGAHARMACISLAKKRVFGLDFVRVASVNQTDTLAVPNEYNNAQHVRPQKPTATIGTPSAITGTVSAHILMEAAESMQFPP